VLMDCGGMLVLRWCSVVDVAGGELATTRPTSIDA
jgi:hypothetical protein